MKRLVTLLLLTQLNQATEIIKEGKPYPVEKIKEQNQQIVKMVVEEISKTLPQTVDKYTTITQIRDENLTLVYTFEINTGSKSDEAIKSGDRERMGNAITKGVCQSSKRFLEAGIDLIYEYFSASSKKELFTFHITQKQCKGFNDE